MSEGRKEGDKAHSSKNPMCIQHMFTAEVQCSTQNEALIMQEPHSHYSAMKVASCLFRN